MDPVSLGSIEYAVEHLLAPLVVVMGHDYCGAVKAAVDGGEVPGSIGAIIAKLQPSVEKAKQPGQQDMTSMNWPPMKISRQHWQRLKKAQSSSISWKKGR